jgi:hypothetical protein
MPWSTIFDLNDLLISINFGKLRDKHLKSGLSRKGNNLVKTLPCHRFNGRQASPLASSPTISNCWQACLWNNVDVLAHQSFKVSHEKDWSLSEAVVPEGPICKWYVCLIEKSLRRKKKSES